ncbi:MAG: hypothetical protein HUU25_06785 [Candidatus Sumerlaeia bacterium]|nr:hypothetical protein [Candidatus Sumerlaeia bacterium]
MTTESAALLVLAVLFLALAFAVAGRSGPRWPERTLFFAGMLCLFRANPPQALTDPNWTLVQTENLLWRGSFDLNDTLQLAVNPETGVRLEPFGRPRQLRELHGRVLFGYPPGASLLSIPFVAVANVLGLRICPAPRMHGYDIELLLQRHIAAVVTAATALTLCLIAATRLPRRWSLSLALALSLSSPLWSVLATGVWSDTWGVLLMALTVLALIRWETAGRPGSAAGMGALLSGMFIAKPTYIVHAGLVMLYLLIVWPWRRRLLLCLWVGLWAAAFVAWSLQTWGHWLPEYYLMGSQFDWTRIPRQLVYLLVSPSRGLLVFMPILIWIGAVALRRRHDLRPTRLAQLAWLNIAAMLVITANWPHWEGGWTFGPRLLSSLVPWFALLATLAIEARERDGPPLALHRIRRETALIWCALALGVFIHARGAHSAAVSCWNQRLGMGPEADQALMDWRRPQWLAGLRGEPPPEDPPRLLAGQRVMLGDDSARPHLGEGWGHSEGHYRWTLARRCVFAFRSVASSAEAAASPELIADHLVGLRADASGLDVNGDGHVSSADLVLAQNAEPIVVRELVLCGAAWTQPGQVDSQRLLVRINGEVAGATEIGQTPWGEILVPLLPCELTPGVNSVVLEFPRATPTRRFDRWSDDARALGLALEWIALR